MQVFEGHRNIDEFVFGLILKVLDDENSLFLLFAK